MQLLVKTNHVIVLLGVAMDISEYPYLIRILPLL